jgi:hypothetical protein
MDKSMSEINIQLETEDTSPERLNTSDPIDALLIELSNDSSDNLVPVGTEQRYLVQGVRNKDTNSAKRLVNTHKGLIAVIAYCFKGFGESRDLLIDGAKALLHAADTYRFNNEEEFSDFATLIIQDELRLKSYKKLSLTPVYFGRPMEQVLQYVAELKKSETALPLLRVEDTRELQRQQKIEELEKLTDEERKILPFLHLPQADVVHKVSLPLHALHKALKGAKTTLGVTSTPGLAIAAWERGVEFEGLITSLPLEEFTIKERMVATRLIQSNSEISEDLELTPKQVTRSIQSLLRKTGARPEQK